MEKVNRGAPWPGYGSSMSLQVLYHLLMLAAAFQVGSAQACPVGCSCGVTAVDCSYAGLTSFPHLPLEMQQSVLTLNLRDNMIASLESNALENYTSLHSLDLENNYLSALPQGLFSATTYLSSLDLENNNLTVLPGGLFSATPQLRGLELDSNHLIMLPWDLFSATTLLQGLTLNNNHLTALPKGIFSTTTQLLTLILAGNELTNFPDGLFSATTQLQFLDLSNNHLSVLPEALFSSATQLETLFLGGNELMDLPESLFNATVKLQFLDLGNNHFTVLPQSLFSATTQLQTLFLSNNGLTELHQGFLSVTNLLQFFYISNNSLTALPGDLFSNNPLLKILFLDNNDLMVLPQGLFKATPRLEALFLAGNELIDLPDSLFSATTQLKHLDLSNNKFSVLPQRLFTATTQLLVLLLSNNHLTVLPQELFSTTVVLQQLSLHSNPWNCNCQLHWLPAFLHSVTEIIPATCVTPDNLIGTNIFSLKKRQLVCAQVVGITPHVEVSEGESAKICITIINLPATGDYPWPFIIEVFSEDGTAGPLDYEEISFTIQLNETHQSTCFDVDTIDNLLAELNETFTVMAVPWNPIFVSNVSTITIINEDSINFRFTNTLYTVSEGDGNVTVHVEMSGNSTVPITVTIMTISTATDTAMENEDFIGVNQTLTFTSNARVQEIQIVIFDDEIIEVFDEHFSIWIRSNGEVIDTAHVTIKENDELIVGFSSAQFNVTESKGQELTFQVVKENATNVTFMVQITRVFLGSAFPDCLALGATVGDYEAEPTTSSLTLRKDEAFTTGRVQIVNDNIEEETEQFRLMLTVTEGAVVTHDGSMWEIADVHIIDDDRVSAEFVKDSYEVRESDGEAVVCILRDNGTDRDYYMHISTFNVNAQDDDFVVLDQESIELPSSREGIEVCSPVTIVNDDIALEGEETFLVNLSIPEDSQLLLGDTSLANITIIDDDVVRVKFTKQSFAVTDDSAVNVSVVIDTRIAQPLNVTVLVNTSSSNGTTGTTNFSLTKMVTFHVLSNLTQVQHATFNLEGVPHLESLNVTLELSDSMAVQPGSIAWATFFIPLPSSTVIHPSSTINASHAAGDSDDSESESVITVIAVMGSIVAILILLVIVIVSIIGYLRWKAYAYRMQPRLQGAASMCKEEHFHILEGDQDCHTGPLIRGKTRYMTHLMDSKQHIPGSCIRLVNCIGKGQFGIVFSARLTGWQDGSMDGVVAVKTLKVFHSEDDVDSLLKESLKMKEFNHSNVLNLIGVSLDAGQSPYIVMPYMANGSLLNYLKKKRPNLNIDNKATEEVIQDARRQLMSMCLQIAKGMEYLAERKVVHRDLAARNCMIDANGVIKVADFGLSENLYTRTYFREGGEEAMLPVKWTAIEGLKDCIFTEKSDVWSFGVTCWEVFTLGTMPYPGVDPFTVMRYLQEGRRLEKPVNAACDDQVYKILLSCWEEDPEERPNFSELVCTITTLLNGIAGYMALEPFRLNTSACRELSTLQEQSRGATVADVEELPQRQETETLC